MTLLVLNNGAQLDMTLCWTLNAKPTNLKTTFFWLPFYNKIYQIKLCSKELKVFASMLAYYIYS